MSCLAPGVVVEDLALLDGLVVMLVDSGGSPLPGGLEVGGYESVARVAVAAYDAGEVPLAGPSLERAWSWGTGGRGESGMSEASCGWRGDTGVLGSEGQV